MKTWQKASLYIIGVIVGAIVLLYLFFVGLVDFAFDVWNGEAGK